MAKETVGDSGVSAEQAMKSAGLASGKVVVYMGPFGIREIDEPSWDHVNVKKQKGVVWNKENGWSVPVDEFSDDALTYLTEHERDFVVKDVEVPRDDTDEA
jgi:hypothetical protein